MSGYQCEWGECTKQVAYLITVLANGSTVSLCEEHYGPGLIPILAVELGADPGEFYSAVERFLKAQEKKVAKELAAANAAVASEDQPEEPPADDDVMGDAVDDQGGMSERTGDYSYEEMTQP